jgi:glycosyltransferase involved in cell wall biosynthesis
MSRLLLTVDHQFIRTSDGRVWVKTIYGYDFWKRYLEIFDEVRIAARVREEDIIEENMLLASGDRVEFFDLPQYRGTKEYVIKYNRIKQEVIGVADACNCAIFRIPSPISDLVQKEVTKRKLPWATEIVNDPWDNFAPNAFKSIFRPIYRYYFTHQVKEYAKKANGVSYVTQNALQKRYPSHAKLYGESLEHFESYYSSILLKEDFFWTGRKYNSKKELYTIVHVNSCVTDFSKGHDVVIRVVKELKSRGMNVKVKFVGDGPKRMFFENMAKDLDVGSEVEFTGLLSSASEVRNVLMTSDILIFPTVGEGLPRTVIEAMAVGLPCLSTAVNGIPELLEKEYLIEQQDVIRFADMAQKILTDEEMYMKISVRNISKAREYENSVLSERRNEFYRKLLNLSE